MARLWLRMSEIYGSQFANQYGEVGGEAFQTWCLALQDMTTEMIYSGFQKLLERERTFVPNLNEFRKLCQVTAEDLGLPSLEAAYLEACNNAHRVMAAKWSHPGVYHAGKAAGWFELRSESAQKTRPAFRAAYDDICKRLKAGEVFELPERDSTRLEHHRNGKQVNTEENKAAGRAALANLKRGLR